MNKLTLRIFGITLIGLTTWYLYWVTTNLNINALFISIPFAVASWILGINTVISVVNHWHSANVKPSPINYIHEPVVGIIIPTYNEPIFMIEETIWSIMSQNWPNNKLVIVVSDDGIRKEVQIAVRKIRLQTNAIIYYHSPEPKSSQLRRGEGKSGNLNSALEFIKNLYPDIKYLETRDADDLVGDKYFLRYCIGQLVNNKEVAFVQTVKECRVSKGDPFGNLEPIFYRKSMSTKFASNATFPLGSGLVWRVSDLESIGGFPEWNMVEDLTSGYEILKRGKRGIFIPIIGAIGQIAPEDIPNFLKQRGTWAIDTLRIFFWKNPIFTKGLTTMQKMHFLELGTFYLMGPGMVMFMTVLIFSLIWNIYPIHDSLWSYSFHFWIYLAAQETFLVLRGMGLSYEQIWRSRQTWMGLSFEFTKALFMVLKYGPHQKPKYKVTRKIHVHNWYWKETFPLYLYTALLLMAITINVLTQKSLAKIDFLSIFWATFFILAMSQTIKNSWIGITIPKLFVFPKRLLFQH